MSNQFCFDVYIPSLHRYVQYYELNNKLYLSILKFFQNNDDNNLIRLLEENIIDLAVDKSLPIKFTRLDKYCVLLSIIMVCISNRFEYQLVCDETEKIYNIEILVGDTIGMINDLELSNIRVDIGPSASISMSIPTSLAQSSDNIITQLSINDKEFDLSMLSTSQVDDIIDHIPYNTYSSLHEALGNIHMVCNDIIYLKYASPHTKTHKGNEYKFNLYDDSFFDFIKILMRDDLLSYYRLYHALITRFHFDMTYIESITPSETKMYVSFIKEDQEDRKKAMAEQSSNTSQPASIPLPQMPDIDPGVENI